MSTTTVVRAVPRTVVGAYLKAARVPLNVASRVTRQADNEQWPPVLAFESFEANVETVLGSLLKDEKMLDRGRLQQARIAKLRKAAELRTIAERERVEADSALQHKRKEADRQRQEAERRAEQREQEVQRQARQRQREVEQKAAAKAAASRRAQTAQEKAIERQERNAKQSALEVEVEALDKTKDAVEAQEKAALVEDAIEGNKVARKLR